MRGELQDLELQVDRVVQDLELDSLDLDLSKMQEVERVIMLLDSEAGQVD